MDERGFLAPLIGIIALVVVAGAGVALYVNQANNQNDGEYSEGEFVNTDADDLQPETEVGSMTGTVADLLRSGRDLTCTFSRADEGGTVAGTVYVASTGNTIRGDFRLDQPNGSSMMGHTIRTGGFNYFWSDQLERGTKTPIDEDEDEPRAGDSQDDVLDEKLEYNCQPWSVDSSKFELPQDREFDDLTQQIQQINQAEDTVQDAQCAACDQLEGPGKAQCLAALGC